MDYRIVWTVTALEDLRDLVRYIAADDRATARRFGDRMIKRIEGLAGFPRIGRKVPEYQNDLIREVILTPYRLIYEVDDDGSVISVLRIWHCARGEPELGR